MTHDVQTAAGQSHLLAPSPLLLVGGDQAVHPLPPALLSAFRSWGGRGSPGQLAMHWNRNAWLRYFEADELPTGEGAAPVDRAMATASAEAIQDGPTALAAFIVAMIWGYGTVGYGPYRTKRIITSNGGRKDFGNQLFELAQTTIDLGGEAAFRYVRDRRAKDRSYLRYLGPAFGTKFTYFVAKAHGQEPAPVLDAVISHWFDRHVDGVHLVLDWFAPGSYSTYLEHLRSWRDQLGLDGIDDVERIIFQAERNSVPTPADLRAALESLRQAFDLQPEEIQDLVQPHLDAIEDIADPIL